MASCQECRLVQCHEFPVCYCCCHKMEMDEISSDVESDEEEEEGDDEA